MTRDGLRNVTGSGNYDGGTAWAGQISDRQRLVPQLLQTSMPFNLLTKQDRLSYIYIWQNDADIRPTDLLHSLSNFTIIYNCYSAALMVTSLSL